MNRYQTAQTVEAYRERCEDRVAVLDDSDRTVIVVADGAGGTGSGDLAAECVIKEVKAVYPQVESAEQWAGELKQIDHRIGAGETTAVVVDLREDRLLGASVGDSQAWIIEYENITNLTAHQVRKPLLGSREACPVAFETADWRGLLMVETDGFCNYVKREKLTALVAKADFYTLPRACVNLVRMPSGALWDDTSIVVCRHRPRRRTRKRYNIG